MDLHELLEAVRHRQLVLDQFAAAWSGEYRQRGGAVYCTKGCGGCCSLAVNCTLPEALLLAASLDAPGRNRLRELAPLLKATADGCSDLKSWLAAYRRRVAPCPFLSAEGSCSIYPARPLSCRALLSTKEPFWCTADFSSLSSETRQAFMASLDRTAVAFPTHYAETPQEIGRELEEAILRQMKTVYGFSVLGCLPWLIWLEIEHGVGSLLSEGPEATRRYLQEQGLLNPFLVLVA